ncbi:MAG: MBOAT family protein [Bacteroidota bacterium]
MLFNSFIFFFFLGIVLPVFYVLNTKTSKNLWLLFASYFFYGYWDIRFCSLLVLSTVIDFFIGQAMDREENPTKRKRLLMVSLFSNLGILAVFKYFNFFIDSFQAVVSQFGGDLDFLHLNIILPVGISFYTFQTLSYTIDIYRGQLKPTKNFLDFALFVSFFPQLVAGPIERASNLLPALSEKLSPSKEQIKQGIILIITGLFRKVMIGDTSGRYVDTIFGNIEYYSSVELLFALFMFSIQIYADFSGYSRIARGCSKLLGVELMINFEQPYMSRNITEFWRRWHISLSSWLRDYLYIPLGGNRKGETRTYINNMITMLLGGLWHGASWNFVIWGGLHGIYLAIHKLSLRGKRIGRENADFSSLPSSLKAIGQMAFTFILVLFTWLFFRSTSWEMTTAYFQGIIDWRPTEYGGRFLIIALVYAAVVILMDVLEYTQRTHTYLLNMKSVGAIIGILVGLLLSTFIYMFQADPLPFIYFQF